MTSSRAAASILLLLSAVLGLSSFLVDAFQLPSSRPTSIPASTTRLHETSDGRRQFLSRGAGAALSFLAGGTISGRPAEASYSAYTHREEDWNARQEKGGEQA